MLRRLKHIILCYGLLSTAISRYVLFLRQMFMIICFGLGLFFFGGGGGFVVLFACLFICVCVCLLLFLFGCFVLFCLFFFVACLLVGCWFCCCCCCFSGGGGGGYICIVQRNLACLTRKSAIELNRHHHNQSIFSKTWNTS